MSTVRKEITDQVARAFQGAMDDRIKQLVASGHSLASISYKTEGGETILLVNDIPDSRFWITHEDGSITVNARPVSQEKPKRSITY